MKEPGLFLNNRSKFGTVFLALIVCAAAGAGDDRFMKSSPHGGSAAGGSMLSGVNAVVELPGRTPVDAGDIVIEPEFFHVQTYGWQVGRDKSASGGCYLHIREGVGDFESEDLIRDDPGRRSGDFYNVTRNSRPIEATTYFMAPEEGTYYVRARTMAHKTDCSNIVGLRVNGGRRLRVGRNRTKLFVWLWHEVGRVNLRKGVNVLSLLTYQDDIKVDQVLLTRKPLEIPRNSPKVFTGGFRKAMPVESEVPAVTMSLVFDTLNVTSTRTPGIDLYLHKNVSDEARARLIVSLDLPGGKTKKDIFDVHVPRSRKLVRYELPVKFPKPIDRREYLLSCVLLVGSKVTARETLVLSHGYDWSVLGPLPFMETEDRGPVEKDASPRKTYQFDGKAFSWRRYRGTHSDLFCVMNFMRTFEGEIQSGTPAAIYAYTEVEAEQSGEYLMKVQGDDHIVVWVNGTEIVRIAEKGPSIRTAREVKTYLDKGRNWILFRLNQTKDQWQAAIRLRTLKDKIAPVTGVPFEKQSASLY